jgi:hypothetical protein
MFQQGLRGWPALTEAVVFENCIVENYAVLYYFSKKANEVQWREKVEAN